MTALHLGAGAAARPSRRARATAAAPHTCPPCGARGAASAQPPCRVSSSRASRCCLVAARAALPDARTEQQALEWENAVAGPRMEAGLDVHRRVHALASRSGQAYLFQWRAFCERQQRSWQDARSAEDEAVLAVFHHEVEQGVVKFEADAASGRLHEWPQRSLHPTQGMPAIAAALRVANEATVGRRRLFRCWTE